MHPKILRLGRGMATLAALSSGAALGDMAKPTPSCEQGVVTTVPAERFYCVTPQMLTNSLQYVSANPILYASDAVTQADAQRTCAKGTIRVIMVTAPQDVPVSEL